MEKGKKEVSARERVGGWGWGGAALFRGEGLYCIRLTGTSHQFLFRLQMCRFMNPSSCTSSSISYVRFHPIILAYSSYVTTSLLDISFWRYSSPPPPTPQPRPPSSTHSSILLRSLSLCVFCLCSFHFSVILVHSFFSFSVLALRLCKFSVPKGALQGDDLTLRLLMSYIYICMEHQFLMFLDHTQRRSTVGRTPLDE